MGFRLHSLTGLARHISLRISHSVQSTNLRKDRCLFYWFLDGPENSKTTSNREPVIRRLGVPLQDQEHPRRFLHPRHFLQQADYTVCLFEALTRFGNHEEVVYEPNPPPLYGGRKMPRQYRLWKFVLPWSDREKVLGVLADFNLNAFSLFQSEEALMETMAMSELDFTASMRS